MRSRSAATLPSPATVLQAAAWSILPSWIVGIEQLVPPLILISGVGLHFTLGRGLRVPVTTWIFSLFVLWTLVSLGVLTDFRAILLFAKDFLSLVAGGAAFLLAANLESTTLDHRRLTISLATVTLIVSTLAIAASFSLLPSSFETPWAQAVDSGSVPSQFLREHILIRELVDLPKLNPGDQPLRSSSVFLYPTHMSAALLALLLLLSLLANHLRGWWRLLNGLAFVGGLGAMILSGSRTGLLFLLLAFGSVLFWRLITRPFGMIVSLSLALTATSLAVILLFTPLYGGESAWHRLFVNYRPGSHSARLTMYQETWRAFTVGPIFGHGVQEMATRSGDTYLRLGSHSEVLSALYRFGLPGLAAYLVVGISIASWIWRELRKEYILNRGSVRTNLLVISAIGIATIAGNGLVHRLAWDVNVYWLSWLIPGLAHTTFLTASSSQDICFEENLSRSTS